MDCINCGSSNVRKFGYVRESGKQRFHCNDCKRTFVEVQPIRKKEAPEKKIDLFAEVKKAIKKQTSIKELCNKLKATPQQIEEVLEKLRAEKYNVIVEDGFAEISNSIPTGGIRKIDLAKFKNKTFRFGFTADNHINNMHERNDVLNAIYDRFEEEGIKEVYNGGNWIDGEFKFNKFEVLVRGCTNQIKRFVEVYPKRKGIKTYFIAGDDHEGWYQQREGIRIGEYMELMAKEAGRNDLIYLGYVEADIELKTKKGKSIIKLMHGGGGSSYALSYTPQKIVESFTGGEKPNILLIGHYHKADFLPAYRNVQVLQGGTTCDQTKFMRKMKLAAHVGGWIVEVQLSEDGAVNRIKTEWLSFYDREYYKKNNYYDIIQETEVVKN